MAGPVQSRRANTRVSNACQRCRRRKIRCSGSHPCNHCTAKRLHCEFVEARKVVVSQEYLQRLQQAANTASLTRDENPGPSPHALPEAISQASQVDISNTQDVTRQLQTPISAPSTQPHAEPSNLLAQTTSAYVSDGGGRLRSLGESSTWSFSRRALLMIKDHANAPTPAELDIHEESRAYSISWNTQGFDNLSNFTELPSIDHAIYLINAVKFHLSPLYHLFDDNEFMRHLHEFYVNPTEKARACKIWYVQFLLLLALGKTSIGSTSKRSNGLPGSELFIRAMSLLPDASSLFSDCLTSIETLCAVALFLQSADMRNSAYIYIGQASRMALVFGLHRERPPQAWPNESVDRCEKLWWTVYILDRTFASSMGVPISIQDKDITTEMPKRDNSPTDTALYIHVRLSRLTALVVDRVYGAEGRLQASFLPTVVEVSKTIASIAEDLTNSQPLSGDGSRSNISRVAAHLHLYYHQAILLTMYPLLLYLFQTRLAESEESPRTTRAYSETTEALLQTCAESCYNMIRILTVIREENLLEISLPFDLERIFAASFAWQMLSMIFPSQKDYKALYDETIYTLEEMIERGCIPAQYRKKELEHLSAFIDGWMSTSNPHLLTSGDRTQQSSPRLLETTVVSDVEHIHRSSVGTGNLIAHQSSDSFRSLDALQPGQVLTLPDMLDLDNTEEEFASNWVDNWLWDASSYS